MTKCLVPCYINVLTTETMYGTGYQQISASILLKIWKTDVSRFMGFLIDFLICPYAIFDHAETS